MSLQDGLLSFQIKETIFLSSDKADIGQIKELELIPDVEIIENTHEISITGCLQLHGRYEVGKIKDASQSGDSDSLLEAMKFTPFHLHGDEANQYLYQNDVELTHRIPLNVSIPLSRIEELGEIYAIVDSFDYDVKTPHQVQILADLKITGIFLRNQEQQTAQEESTIATQQDQEQWEFVHVADPQDEQNITPTSIEEIERKLAELEREVEAREQQYNQPYTTSEHYPYSNSEQYPYATSEQYPATPYVTSHVPRHPYFPPYEPQAALLPYESQASLPTYESQASLPPYQSQAVHEEDVGAIPAVANADQTTELETEPETEAETTDYFNTNTPEQEVYVTQAIDTNISDSEFQQYDEERLTELHEGQQLIEVAEAVEDEAAVFEDEAVVAEQEVEVASSIPEPKEMKVAISSKPVKEKEVPQSITSLFTNAGRSKAEQAYDAKTTDSSSTASHVAEESAKASVTVLRNNLGAFAKDSDQKFSRLKMCIIQRDETLQTIAERYSMSVSRIVEVNQLASDRIVEGQVLYIPQ